MQLNTSTASLALVQAKHASKKPRKARFYLFFSLFIISWQLPTSSAIAKTPVKSWTAQVNGTRTVPASDSLALVALYDSTNGAGWTNKNNWLTGSVNTWYGVTVAGGRITKLKLPFNQLSGSLPRELGNLAALKILELGYNQLKTTIPNALGNLKALEVLHLANNQLSGSIPSSLEKLLALQELNLAYNQLSGNIPADLAKLVALQQLHLANNQLSGNIPAELGNLLALEVLYLGNNHLSGSIPAELGNLSALQMLGMSYNQLSGSIPTSLGNLLALQHLHLHRNQLTGSIPVELGNMTALKYLYLNRNQLTGNIPVELGNLTNFIGLFLDRNQLSGSIPNELGNLTALKELDLSYNQLSGSIPNSLGNLIGLKGLYLANNQLSGSLSASLGNLMALQMLDLSNNQLSGDLPSELDKLIALQWLFLTNNNLSGSFPAGFGHQKALQFLFLSNNQFTSLPTFAPNVNALYVNQNHLTFESLENNINKFDNILDYSPQDNIGLVANLVLTAGQSLSLSAWVGGANNLYQWTLNGADIIGATQDSLTVTTGGVYECTITNTLVPGLILHRRPVYVSGNSHIPYQAITFDAIPEKIVGDAPFPLSAFVSSGLPITYTSSNSAVATVLGNIVTLVGEGTTTLIASQAGNVNYYAAASVGHLLTVFSTRTVSEADSLALVALYNNTNGAGWRTKTNWLTGKVDTWYGVGVDDRRVTGITLSGNQLIGSIPIELGNLTAIRYMYLWNNELSGSIPASLGNLTALRELELFYNQLSGSLPSELGNLTTLKKINLEGNQLSGSIPASLGNLTSLRQLFLQHNQLSGSIPASLGKLTVLRELSLFNNQLSGSIPGELGDLPTLQFLFLDHNQLSGSIPAGLGNLAAVRWIDLGHNQLSGSIPASFGNLKTLSSLYLNNNQLSGSLPSEFGNMSSLGNLWLSNNQLTGSVPASLGNLTYLSSLSLSHNQLSGSIPASLGNFAASGNLYLDFNHFASLPQFSSNLYQFYVNNNQLTFESLESNISKFNYPTDYAPQDSVGMAANHSLTAGQSLALSALVGGANNRYQWTLDEVDIDGATNASLTVTDAGSYGCKITNTVVTGLTLDRRRVNVSLSTASVCQATGTILREVWTNLSGSHITDIPVLSQPNLSSQLTSLQAPANFGDRYGQRLRGYICAPQTGAYTFWIVADNDAQLFLSTDAEPANKQVIAFIKNGYALPSQWIKYPSQKSVMINLVAGQRYYLEAIHKEEYGGDNLIIGWRTPVSATNATPVIVPGSVLSPFVPVVVTACAGSGSIQREYWANVLGNTISSIPVNTVPSSTSLVSSFEGPTNVADKYAARYRGYLCAPATGQYRFAIAGDNEVELWLSTNESAVDKQKLAFISGGYTNPREWSKYATQQSAWVTLQAGQKYYIEALHKEATGGDNLAVGWLQPGSVTYFVIPGANLVPFQATTAREALVEEVIGLEAYPNPFSSEVTVNFTTPVTGQASLDLYDLQGVRVQSLFAQQVQAGESHQVVVEGSALHSGLYLLRLINGTQVSHLKVILSK